MSTTKKLSEILKNWSDSDFEDSLADDARALEERIAELERTARENRNWREAHADAIARAEAAEAERKEFMLETQRKEIECNELASEVARLREAYGVWGDAAEHIETEREALFVENRALRAKLDAVRAECERGRNDARLPWHVFASILAILDGEGGDE